jgi:predicted dinucleotide-binding enzyme
VACAQPQRVPALYTFLGRNQLTRNSGNLCHPITVRRSVAPGNGNYGRALARRLVSCGVPVVIGSRDPKAAVGLGAWGTACDVVSSEAAFAFSNLIILAIPHSCYVDFVIAHSSSLSGKILLDVTNPVTPSFASWAPALFCKTFRRNADVEMTGESSAQRLQATVRSKGVKDCAVVKAFNNVSAYELDDSASRLPGPVVPVSADDPSAREVVMNLARKMGFSPLDFGGLETAVIQERTVHRFFDGWVTATTLTVIIAVLWSLYWANQYYADDQKANSIWFAWLLDPVGDIATVLLALTFIPGSIAGFWQLARGSAKRPFPSWFGSWMNIRKQIGVMGFFVASIHAFGGCLHGKPHEMEGMPAPGYNEYTYLSFGPIAYCFYAVLAACTGTLSAQGQMSWMEFKFVFSTLGYVTIALVLIHVGYLIPGWQSWLAASDAPHNKVVPLYFSFGIAALAMLLRLVLWTPPLSWKLAKLRK